jgi:paraquat-inducible protein B
MNDKTPQDDLDQTEFEPAEATIRRRRPMQIIWLIPIVAGIVAGFLGWRAYYNKGPTVTLTFQTADGLQAGQTKVKHKAVELGTVESIGLSPNLDHVIVKLEMSRAADKLLTENARFWVVRPRLGVGGISGLDTLVSGSYIAVDPGKSGGEQQYEFTGLENPPAVRSDEPGRTFVLKANGLGSLSTGSPVFYRELVAGEVIDYELGPQGAGMTIRVFIRAPYDRYVHEATHFWNASGVSLDMGPSGLQLRIESLIALLSGGVAFDTEPDGLATPVAPTNANFTLFDDRAAATSAGFRRRIPLMSRFEGSVQGLVAGSPVVVFGIQVGTVTSVKLDPTDKGFSVLVGYEMQPERMIDARELAATPLDAAQSLVAHGWRAQLQTSNLLTGQMAVAFVFVPDAPAATVTEENGVIMVPSTPGGLAGITSGLSDIVQKLNRVPLDQIAQNLNDTLHGANETVNNQDLKQALQSLAATLASANELVHKFDASSAPAIKRLPEIAQTMQAALDRATKLLGSMDTGYGDNSSFHRDMQHLLDQAASSLRSIRLLADYLDAHPNALLVGRDVKSTEK